MYLDFFFAKISIEIFGAQTTLRDKTKAGKCLGIYKSYGLIR